MANVSVLAGGPPVLLRFLRCNGEIEGMFKFSEGKASSHDAEPGHTFVHPWPRDRPHPRRQSLTAWQADGSSWYRWSLVARTWGKAEGCWWTAAENRRKG